MSTYSVTQPNTQIMIFKKASYDPFKHKISILERFLKDHVTKTGAMAAENVALSWLEYIYVYILLNCIIIENSYYKL